jgi:hypothetical protein
MAGSPAHDRVAEEATMNKLLTRASAPSFAAAATPVGGAAPAALGQDLLAAARDDDYDRPSQRGK